MGKLIANAPCDQDVERHYDREHEHRPYQRIEKPRQRQLVLHRSHMLIQAAHGDLLIFTDGRADRRFHRRQACAARLYLAPASKSHPLASPWTKWPAAG